MTETDLENALQRWIAPRVAPAPAIWDRQKGPRPVVAFVTLRLVGPSGPSGAAPDWQHSVDGSPEAWADGQEIVASTRHDHEYDLRVQSYAATPSAARSLLLKVHDAAYSEAAREALDVDGIVVADVGSLQDAGALLDTDWEGRAVLDVRIRIADLVTERTNSIQTVGYLPGAGIA